MDAIANIVAFFEQPIAVPEPWNGYHAIWLLLLTASLLCLVYAAPNLRSNPSLTRGITRGLGLFLLCIEVLKQIFGGLHAAEGTVYWQYPWYMFPLQLCSTPLYICALLPFARGSVARPMQMYLGTFGMLGGIAVMLFPQSVFCDYLFLNLHTMLWHSGLILLGATQWLSGNMRGNFGEYCGATCIFLVFAAVAAALNFAFPQLAGKGFDLFYISPYISPGTLGSIEEMRRALPYPIYFTGYLAALCTGAALLFAAMRSLVRLDDAAEELKRAKPFSE